MTTNERFEGESNVHRSGMAQKKTPPLGPGPLPDGYDVRALWYRLLSRPWSCLVVVSPERTPNTLRLARRLAELGTQYLRHPIEVIDGLELDLERSRAIAHMVGPQAGMPRLADPRFIIALDSPIVNPVAIGLLTVGDAILMLLEKGVSSIPQARQIIEIVGRERFLGAVLAGE
jgi:hypothetical protein